MHIPKGLHCRAGDLHSWPTGGLQMNSTSSALRSFMRRWATGVSIVSAQHDSAVHGMTVNSFTSISLTPALILVSLEAATRTHALVTESGRFAVSILREQDQELADRFAGRMGSEESRETWLRDRTAPTGIPIPEYRLAAMECETRQAIRAGTHTIFIAESVWVDVDQADFPLLYYNQKYRRLID